MTVLARQAVLSPLAIFSFGISGLIALPLLYVGYSAMQAELAIWQRLWTTRIPELLFNTVSLAFGVGIATGYATLGHIGTGDQFHYTAVGSVVNLASRLCDEADSGEILISEPVFAKAEGMIEVSPGGEYKLKGFPKAVRALKLITLTEGDYSASAQKHSDGLDMRDPSERAN